MNGLLAKISQLLGGNPKRRILWIVGAGAHEMDRGRRAFVCLHVVLQAPPPTEFFVATKMSKVELN